MSALSALALTYDRQQPMTTSVEIAIVRAAEARTVTGQ